MNERFEEVRQTLKQKPKPRITAEKCALCGVAFDPVDARVWTRETGACHFYPCFLDFKGKLDVKREWVKLAGGEE